MATIHPVIMCGGVGSRLWPASRADRAKQFLNLVEPRSLLEATADRLNLAGGALDIAPAVVVCGADQAEPARAHLEAAGRPPRTVLVEPFGKNTAAVGAVAALETGAVDPKGLVLLLAADHHVADPEGFWRGVAAGAPAAAAGRLVTLGIEPTGPETGYGYISRGAPIGGEVYAVRTFKEKPDRETAEAYLAQGGFYWNAGVFLARADALIEAYERFAPEILAACRAAHGRAQRAGPAAYLDAEAFDACPAAPIDTAIMERSPDVAVVASVRAGWSDVGSWAAVAELKTAGGDDPQVLEIDCEGCLVETDGAFVAALGLKDMIIVSAGGAVLVAPKARSQEVKAVVERLKKAGRTDLL